MPDSALDDLRAELDDPKRFARQEKPIEETGEADDEDRDPPFCEFKTPLHRAAWRAEVDKVRQLLA